MDDAHDGSGHVPNAHDEGGGGGGRECVVAAAGHRAGPYLMRNDMQKMQSNTQNGHPNLMRRCPSLSMRSNLLHSRKKRGDRGGRICPSACAFNATTRASHRVETLRSLLLLRQSLCSVQNCGEGAKEVDREVKGRDNGIGQATHLSAWLVSSPIVPSLQTFHGALD